MNHRLQHDLLLESLREGVCLLGLMQRPGEAVQDVATVAGRFEDTCRHHVEHQLVGNKIASLQIVGGNLPNPRSLGHLGTQQGAARQVCDAIVHGQLVGLCPFAGPRIGHQENSHPRHANGAVPTPSTIQSGRTVRSLIDLGEQGLHARSP